MDNSNQPYNSENTNGTPQSPEVSPYRQNYPPIQPTKRQPFLKRIKGTVSTFILFASAILLAWVMITFIFQTYVVEGQSMEPTLSENDRLIVIKAGKTWADITGDPYIPNRGSIIIFNKLGAENGSDRQLIKRVIGLPGDRVIVNNGSLTVYNNEYPNGFSPDQLGGFTLSSNVTSGNVDITVPSGELFVAGDNRSNSLDSRNFGTVSSNEIVGELKLRILPLGESKTF